MPDGRRVAVIVAVADARPAPYLAGALNAAREFQAWASALGYETWPITDEAKPVTMARLQAELPAILPDRDPSSGSLRRPIHRLIVYFAGHGLIREAEEGLWLLSDWNDALRAVAVEPLKRRLYGFGVDQICIIADACRELPGGVPLSELAADPVLGRGPVTIDKAPPVDKYIAAQDGAQAYAIVGDSPDQDRCLFSGVLIDGLWGADGAISTLMPGKVTSRSLGTYLEREAPKRALAYRLKLNPSVTPVFPDDDCVYFDKGSAPPRPPAAPWPPPPPPPQRPDPLVRRFGVQADLDLPVGEPNREEAESDGEPLGLLPPTFTLPPNPAKFLPPEIAPALQARPPPGHATLVAAGPEIVAIHSRADTGVERSPSPGAWSVGPIAPPYEPGSAPVLVEFSDGVLCPIAAYPDCSIAIVRDAVGATAISYHDHKFGVPALTPGSTERAIAEMEAGALRADAAVNYAVELRDQKHSNPVLGVISAYLYDAISDTDSIRRMAAFYVQSGQPVPYDVALLALVRGEWRGDDLWVQIPEVPAAQPRSDLELDNPWAFQATLAAIGRVGGAWPWMRQGWAYLDDPVDVEATLIRPALAELARDLRPARFTSFGPQGGQGFARAFELSKITA